MWTWLCTVPFVTVCHYVVGIAETGSGKTCAFLVPLLCYMLELPDEYIDRCADEGITLISKG